MKLNKTSVLNALFFVILSIPLSSKTLKNSNTALSPVLDTLTKATALNNVRNKPESQSDAQLSRLVEESSKNSQGLAQRLDPEFRRLLKTEIESTRTERVLLTIDNDAHIFFGLSDRFEDPKKLEQFMDSVSFSINGREIPRNRQTEIPIRKGDPIKVTWTITTFNMMAIHIKFDYSLQEHNHKDPISIATLLYKHPELKAILENPSPESFFTLVKKNGIKWPNWLDLAIHLPQLERTS